MEVLGIFNVLVCLLSLFFSLQRALEYEWWRDDNCNQYGAMPRLTRLICRWDASAGWLAASMAWALFVWTI